MTVHKEKISFFKGVPLDIWYLNHTSEQAPCLEKDDQHKTNSKVVSKIYFVPYLLYLSISYLTSLYLVYYSSEFLYGVCVYVCISHTLYFFILFLFFLFVHFVLFLFEFLFSSRRCKAVKLWVWEWSVRWGRETSEFVLWEVFSIKLKLKYVINR